MNTTTATPLPDFIFNILNGFAREIGQLHTFISVYGRTRGVEEYRACRPGDMVSKAKGVKKVHIFSPDQESWKQCVSHLKDAIEIEKFKAASVKNPDDLLSLLTL